MALCSLHKDKYITYYYDETPKFIIGHQKIIIIDAQLKRNEKDYKLARLCWKNYKHGQQWINTINNYTFPKIENMLLDQIQPKDMVDVSHHLLLSQPS